VGRVRDKDPGRLLDTTRIRPGKFGIERGPERSGKKLLEVVEAEGWGEDTKHQRVS